MTAPLCHHPSGCSVPVETPGGWCYTHKADLEAERYREELLEQEMKHMIAQHYRHQAARHG